MVADGVRHELPAQRSDSIRPALTHSTILERGLLRHPDLLLRPRLSEPPRSGSDMSDALNDLGTQSVPTVIQRADERGKVARNLGTIQLHL
jgi:hypothetical protein